MYLYIYIYRERERDTYTYICIYCLSNINNKTHKQQHNTQRTNRT